MPLILAAVANPSPSKFKMLSSIRFNPTQLHLKDWSLVKVTGCDRESFFQGQVTNDLFLLELNQGQLSARLNRTGKLQAYFFIAKFADCLFLLCPNDPVLKIKNDFEKYIIMDDVSLEIMDNNPWLRFNYFLKDTPIDGLFFDFNFYGLNARLVLESHPSLPLTNENELEKIRILNGWPKWGVDVDDSYFINDCFLNEVAISYKKGCFLGQETVAKIENNRGAAFYPVLLKLNEECDLSSYLKSDFLIDERKAGTLLYQVGQILQVKLYRDFRIAGRELEIVFADKKIKATVTDLPYYKGFSRRDIALELYHLGVSLFQDGNLDEAIDTMVRSIDFDSTLADTYESLGVILGRMGKFQEAIELMDKLLAVNPQSVMAHTNKSLYLMKLGKIEEAEAEKSLATVKSFAFYGEEAKLKKQLEIEKKKKEEDLLRREKMFLQVLEIDEEDTIALYGMADIYFHRKEYQAAIKNLEKVISVDPKYSTAYLLLGKAYEATSDKKKAILTYQEGILVSSRQGDLVPANDMQSRLNQLVKSSGLS